MKLLLTAFCAAMITAPLAFAGDKCDKKKCDKETEESTLVAEKCKKKCDKEEEKKEGTLIAEKCKKKCDKEEAAEESTLAHCGKCGKGDKHEKEEEKKEGTLA
jgi:hypothetical protein